MSAPRWRTTNVVQGFDPECGHAVPVKTGLVATDAGSVLIALQVGEITNPVHLTLQAVRQLVADLSEALAERFELTGETLGGDES